MAEGVGRRDFATLVNKSVDRDYFVKGNDEG